LRLAEAYSITITANADAKVEFISLNVKRLMAINGIIPKRIIATGVTKTAKKLKQSSQWNVAEANIMNLKATQDVKKELLNIDAAMTIMPLGLIPKRIIALTIGTTIPSQSSQENVAEAYIFTMTLMKDAKTELLNIDAALAIISIGITT
jgi:hypothetical protein